MAVITINPAEHVLDNDTDKDFDRGNSDTWRQLVMPDRISDTIWY